MNWKFLNLITLVRTKIGASILGALLAIIGILSYMLWHQHQQELAAQQKQIIEQAAREAALRNSFTQFSNLIKPRPQQP